MAVTVYFRFRELRHKVELHHLTDRVVPRNYAVARLAADAGMLSVYGL